MTTLSPPRYKQSLEALETLMDLAERGSPLNPEQTRAVLAELVRLVTRDALREKVAEGFLRATDDLLRDSASAEELTYRKFPRIRRVAR